MKQKGRSKKSRMLLTLCMVLLLITGSVQTCFAVEGSGDAVVLAAEDGADVPVQMDVEQTMIDFSVTERINMRGAEDSTALTVDPLIITNNNQVAILELDSVIADGVDEWTIISDATDFVTMNANTRSFSLVADQTFDMSTGAYEPAVTLNPAEDTTIGFSGKIGVFSTAVSDIHAANVVTTISMKEDEDMARGYIRLHITYSAKSGHYSFWEYVYAEGRSWEDWIENSDTAAERQFYIGEDNGIYCRPKNTVGNRSYWVKMEDVDPTEKFHTYRTKDEAIRAEDNFYYDMFGDWKDELNYQESVDCGDLVV